MHPTCSPRAGSLLLAPRKLIAAAVLSLGLAFGGMVAHDAVSPTPAHAWSFGGHCGWSTDGQWHWSPAEGLYYKYLWHTVIDGKYWRVYAEYSWGGTYLRSVIVYCG